LKSPSAHPSFELSPLSAPSRRSRAVGRSRAPAHTGSLVETLEDRQLLTTLPSGFTESRIGTFGFTSPTAMAMAPDGRIFVAEQPGRLRVIKDGQLLAKPFVTVDTTQHGERGLVGVELDPDFESNGYVYVYYTAGTSTANRVSRFTASGDVAVAGSEKVLLQLDTTGFEASIHQGGGLHFGKDGKLYISVGDHGGRNRTQKLDNQVGKILRINSDGTIPADNPFYNQTTGKNKAIWAIGLRNPFTFAVQPGTGKIHINDVGQDTWEEINLGVAGANYGWPSTEGPTTAAGVTAPLFAYKHADATPLGSGAGGFFKGFAIAGGAFYPATGAFPDGYRDQYYFADFVSRFVGRVDLANDNAAYAFVSLSGQPVDLLVGSDGAIYVLTRSGVTRISAP